MNDETKNLSWYREPLMWLVLGLPATVVVAGLATMVIASSNPESLVSEPHSKVGFTIRATGAEADRDGGAD